LLEHGADISIKNNIEEDPLEVARKHGKPYAIQKAGMLFGNNILYVLDLHSSIVFGLHTQMFVD